LAPRPSELRAGTTSAGGGVEGVLQQVDEFIDHFQLLLTPKKLMVKFNVSSFFLSFFSFF
jgi:hypothetical protein